MNEEAAIAARRLDWLAIVTYVLAVLWLLGAASVAALYVGRRSLRRQRADQTLRGRTVTLTGIAVAIFGIAMAGLWIVLWLTV